mmetsp:Transcript_7634/g.10873  ORF Transcript_7634/g.10873 Transcript_7634/m.10873 type:complete len:312 (+) Transcript_7634:215-1150(+)
MSAPLSSDYQYGEVATDDANTGTSESLIEGDVPATTGVPMIEVIAPGTLPEGYTFEAEVGSQSVTVTVPQGGVEEGQKFTVPLQTKSESGTVDMHAMATPRVSVPIGNWKDHWCNFCAFGCCHAVLCNAYWCTPVLLGQVMSRMKLDWLAREGNSSGAAMTFKIVFAIFLVYILLDPFLAVSPFIPGTTITTMRNLYDYVVIVLVSQEENPKPGQHVLPQWATSMSIVNFLYGSFFLGYIVYVMTKTRQYIRKKYAIPELYCKSGYEDLCCSLCCPCCTAAHMARHTADYDTYASSCCTDTGLPAHVPSIV